jgi:hypothetical protein
MVEAAVSKACRHERITVAATNIGISAAVMNPAISAPRAMNTVTLEAAVKIAV